MPDNNPSHASHASHASHPPEGAASRRRAIEAPFSVDFVHRVRFTRDVLDAGNHLLRDVLDPDQRDRARTLFFIDDGVARAWPGLVGSVHRYARAHGDVIDLVEEVRVVEGGEAAKNGWDVFHEVVEMINRGGICRRSYVVAIGGGAMLDAVGFAAATAHRGVRLVRVPTTTLAQADAAVGVKNGINAFGKKNFIGAFSPPWAVINDERFLETLDDRDWRCGLSEAVKVSLLRDADEFRRIVAAAPRLARREADAMRPILARSAELHMRHITEGGDPFEMLAARPLDFGHWAGHKLEQMTSFDVRHGEGVAIGLALDVTYAVLRGLLGEGDGEAILACLETLGFALYHPALERTPEVLGGLEEFREHLGGRLTITLLCGIGDPVDVHEMDQGLVVEAVSRLRERAGVARGHRSAG